MHLLDFNFYNFCVVARVFHCVQGKTSWCHGSSHNIFQFEALVCEAPKGVKHMLLKIPHWDCGAQKLLSTTCFPKMEACMQIRIVGVRVFVAQ